MESRDYGLQTTKAREQGCLYVNMVYRESIHTWTEIQEWKKPGAVKWVVLSNLVAMSGIQQGVPRQHEKIGIMHV